MSTGWWRGMFRLVIGACLALLLLWGSGAGTEQTLPRKGTLLVEIDATRGPDLAIHLALRGLPVRERMYLKRSAPLEEIDIRDVRAVTADGQPLTLEIDRDRWKIGGSFEGASTFDIDVNYTATVGGLGRHGHQGYIGEDWATFDGRVVLAAVGVQDLAEIRVRYQMPDGWIAVTPFRREGDSYVVDGFGAANWEALSTACVGLGQFSLTERTLGSTPLVIALYSGWDDATRAKLVAGIDSVSGFFRDELGFDPKRPFQVVFTPAGADGKPVFGGAWSAGACYERPLDGLRNWQLLGHRFAHPLNKDLPDGIAMRDARDAWFTEGWASYIEIVSTIAVGLDENKQGFNRLYQGYLQAIDKHPEYVRALADEPRATGDAKEFQHYTAGPLVVKMLDNTLRARSGKNLESFMRDIFARYRGFSPPVPLREELERWSGASFDDFWAMYVDKPAAIVPVWEEWLSRPDAERSGPVIGSVGRMSVTEGYLFYLLRDGGFDDLRQLEVFLGSVAQRETLLKEREISLWPSALSDRTAPVGAAARLQMDRAQLDLPLDLVSVTRSRGCGGSPSAARREALLLDHSTEQGRLLYELEQAEERYTAHRGTLVRSIDLKWGLRDERGDASFPYSFAVRASDPLFVVVGWNDAIASASLDIFSGETLVYSKEILVEPGWKSSWSTFTAKNLGDAKGLLTARVRAGETVLAERAFWRR